MRDNLPYLPYPRDLRRKPLGDPVMVLEGHRDLGYRGSADDVTYVRFHERTNPPPYGDEAGLVIRSLGQVSEKQFDPWLAAGIGFTAGALLCALLYRR